MKNKRINHILVVLLVICFFAVVANCVVDRVGFMKDTDIVSVSSDLSAAKELSEKTGLILDPAVKEHDELLKHKDNIIINPKYDELPESDKNAVKIYHKQTKETEQYKMDIYVITGLPGGDYRTVYQIEWKESVLLHNNPEINFSLFNLEWGEDSRLVLGYGKAGWLSKNIIPKGKISLPYFPEIVSPIGAFNSLGQNKVIQLWSSCNKEEHDNINRLERINIGFGIEAVCTAEWWSKTVI